MKAKTKVFIKWLKGKLNAGINNNTAKENLKTDELNSTDLEIQH